MKYTAHTLSACLEVRPRDDWVTEWSFPSVQYTIEVKPADRQMGTIKRNKRSTFTPSVNNHGWNDLLNCSGYDEMKKQGWVFADDTVRFHITVEGTSLGQSQRKRPEADQYTQMWEEMRCSDMRVRAGDGGPELPCHRVVLSMRSPVFDRMLASDMKEGLERRLVLPKASSGTVRALLEYMYTRSIPEAAEFDLHSLQELFKLGDQYDLPELCAKCASSAAEILSPANAVDVLAFLGAHRGHPKVNEHFRGVKRKVQQDDTMFDALVLGYVEASQQQR
eukprot:CAMPEP_0171183962 /NCGR_PEP_ID=MMETSP0790-20130122/15548_1 /TAXON_ID=2925 /ORGANISM="Alexandrium catenella, Strain OF101" /LENGTH=277 /DNA_ID=CAMNT_0011648953 /DNA_START=204 /DNA_END=1037 /DNA_ORIENTATION=+